MPTVLHAGEWSSPPILLTVRARHRLRGLRPRARGRGLIMRASSVHSFGMEESLWVVALDPAGVVVEIRMLLPGRVAFFRRAGWLLEVPATSMPPPLGATLQARTT